MITNQCGFPILENDDSSSSMALRELAEVADTKLMEQEVEIDYLERPEVAIVSLSAPQVITTGVSIIDFDTEVYVSRSSARAVLGIDLFGQWRSGIYHTGASIDVITSGTVNGFFVDLELTDARGPRLLNAYSESYRHAESNTSRGAISINISRMVEIHNITSSRIQAQAGVVGGGSVSIQTVSTLWCHRIRGLSDV